MRYSIHTTAGPYAFCSGSYEAGTRIRATGLGLIMAGNEYLLDGLSRGNDCRTASDAGVG